MAYRSVSDRPLRSDNNVGVYPTKSGRCRAQINRGGVCKYLGTFPTIDLARAAVAPLLVDTPPYAQEAA